MTIPTTANVFVFRRQPDGYLHAGQYQPHRRSDGSASVQLVCPDCEHPTVLGGEYEIHDSGIVTPAFACTYVGCKFHQMIRLEDWTA